MHLKYVLKKKLNKNYSHNHKHFKVVVKFVFYILCFRSYYVTHGKKYDLYS